MAIALQSQQAHGRDSENTNKGDGAHTWLKIGLVHAEPLDKIWHDKSKEAHL
jgi:hypothetical protein